MIEYQRQLRFILENGELRDDRTGTGTIGVFGLQSRFDLRKGFPALTTKKLAWKAVVSELLWFLEGSGDERRLAEILHGTRDPAKKTIWSANASAPYWKPSAKFAGDLGRVYGKQWRQWRFISGEHTVFKAGGLNIDYDFIDQIAVLIDGIKKDPYGRRHIVSAWNPAELRDMALPPCHILAQFYVGKNGELSCQMYQRSADFLLGSPFNIASYSLLTHMIAQVCDLSVGEFIYTIGDAHVYSNHVEQANEQLSRTPLSLPSLWLNPSVKNIDDFTMEDIKLLDYESHPPISAPMAV